MSSHEQAHDDQLIAINPPTPLDRKRPYSIDLTFELERQLDSESLPTTPAEVPESESKRHSLDPHVLASIIMQLRQSLTAMTKERDDLLALVTNAHSQEADLKDNLQLMTEKCTSMEDALEHAKQKAKDDEDAIAMLRTKVEESRRGLMRLQTESRRMSTGPAALDMSRAGIPSLAGPASSKRASFTPLAGPRPLMTGHRRGPSLSDSALPPIELSIHEVPPTPNGQTISFSETSPIHQSLGSRRGFYRGSSPPQMDLSPTLDPLAQEVANLRKEVKTVRDELEETRHELTESNEAREASETCLTALREFISENNVGLNNTGNKPLPPPSSSAPNDSEADSKKGWGFKLWKADISPKPINIAPVASIPTPKFSGFFSSRASVSSNTSSTFPPLARDSIYNGSDTSSVVESVAEPISPISEPGARVLVLASGSPPSSDLTACSKPLKDHRVMMDNTNMVS